MIISVRARGHCKVPAEVSEDSRVLRERRLARPPIASKLRKPGLSPPERTGLDTSRVNHGLRQLAPVPPLLVLCLVFFNEKIVTKRK